MPSKRARVTKKKVTIAPAKAVDESEHVVKKSKLSHSNSEGPSTTVRPPAVDVTSIAKATDNVQSPAGEKTAEPISGKFDLYWMVLPFLTKIWKENTTKKDGGDPYDPLFNKLSEIQRVPDRSLKILLSSNAVPGRLQASEIRDPFEEMPFDIAITDITTKSDIVFTAAERKDILSDNKPLHTSGITGKLVLAESTCIVSSASGTFKMRGPIWTNGEKEIFEGYMAFDVQHSSLSMRKGHGRGSNTKLPFWAIRAAKDKDGKEIGLDEWSEPPSLASYSGADNECGDYGGHGGFGRYGRNRGYGGYDSDELYGDYDEFGEEMDSGGDSGECDSDY